MLSQSYLEIAVIIGLMNHFITEPLIHHYKNGNHEAKKSRFLDIIKQLLLSFIIITLITVMHNGINHYMELPMEPVSFGFVYQVINVMLLAAMKRVRNIMYLKGGLNCDRA